MENFTYPNADIAKTLALNYHNNLITHELNSILNNVIDAATIGEYEHCVRKDYDQGLDENDWETIKQRLTELNFEIDDAEDLFYVQWW